MTSANIMNLGKIQAASIDLSVKQAEKDISAAFASLLTRPVSQNQTKSLETGNQAQEVSDASVAYEKFQYQDKEVEKAVETPFSEKMDAAEEEISEFEEKLVQAFCDELEMSEEDVWEVLETLGVTLLDLLDPQKLAEVFVDFKGLNDQVEVLMDANFESLFVQMNELGEELLENLGVTMEELDDMVEKIQLPNVDSDVAEVVQVQENVAEVDALQQDTQVLKDEIPQEVGVEAKAVETVEEETPIIVIDKREVSKAETEIETENVKSVESAETIELKPIAGQDKQEGARDAKQDPDGENQFVFHQQTSVESAPVEQAPESFTYSDVRTLDIIEQVAENVRVVLSNEETSMSMQLNPESLGKVFINVTTKEGVVNAQITAQNEIVKEALEVQLADLRANLNQSGVKVNEIEITVATHEFERNLDQNGREEQKREEEKKPSKRRNISIDTLDDLAGLMTEEEQLAMQIMKDNGNSVDLNA